MRNRLGLALGLMCVLAGIASDLNGQARDTAALEGLPLAQALTGSVISDQVVETRNDQGQRGVTQRSLFRLGTGLETLKIAFVFDGTQSMQDDIQGLKNVLADVVSRARQQTGARKVEVAFVVYRDLFQGADDNPQHRANPVSIYAQQRFGRQLFLDLPAQQQTVLSRLDAIRVDTGLPGAWEQVDRGVHAALTQLNWSPESGTKVGRVLILAGDSPPWPIAWQDRDPFWSLVPKTRLRAHTSDKLISIARKQNVKIFSIACRGWKLNQQSSDLRQLRPELVEFLRELARGTGGTFLDTRDENTRKRVMGAVAAQGSRTALRSVGTVTKADLEKRRQQLIKSRRIRIGILPKADLSLLDDDAFKFQSVNYGQALRLFHLLHAADARQVRNLQDTRRVFRELSKLPKAANNAERLRQFTARLDVDLLIGVEVEPAADGEDQLVLSFQSVEGQDFQRVIRPDQAQAALASVLTNPQFNKESAPSLAQDLKLATVPVGFQSSDAQTLLAFALDDLQQAASSVKGSPESLEWNRSAAERLRRVLQDRPQDAWAHLLLANARHNLGDLELRDNALRQAYRFRAQTDPLVALEIEADYALFVGQDVRQSVQGYRKLISDAPRWSNTALRAHWMLAGICLGDFGPPESSPEKIGFQSWNQLNTEARKLVIDLLVFWPRSPQAEFYRRYSETPEGTHPRFDELPTGSRLMYVRNPR